VGVVILADPVVLAEYDAADRRSIRRIQDPARQQRSRSLRRLWSSAELSDLAMFLASNTRTRYVANPRLIQINTPGFTGDFSLLLSNNANTGGTYFGDSGGPNFLGDSNVVAGVTSFGHGTAPARAECSAPIGRMSSISSIRSWSRSS
jgi:hypothetical protein